jgi:large subunit ribosomal protein L36
VLRQLYHSRWPTFSVTGIRFSYNAHDLVPLLIQYSARPLRFSTTHHLPLDLYTSSGKDVTSHFCVRKMSSSLISSLKALSLRIRPASRVFPTQCLQPTVRSIWQSALAPTRAQRPREIARSEAIPAALAQQQTRGMKVQSSVKKRCEHCKVSPSLASSGSCLFAVGRVMFMAFHVTLLMPYMPCIMRDWTPLTLMLSRSCEEKPANDTEAISTLSAARTRGTNSARVNISTGEPKMKVDNS